jgi:hypothetical protein
MNKINVVNNTISPEERNKFKAKKEKRKIAKNLEINDLDDVAAVLEKIIKRIMKLEAKNK